VGGKGRQFYKRRKGLQKGFGDGRGGGSAPERKGTTKVIKKEGSGFKTRLPDRSSTFGQYQSGS